jgi:hypothetical protein
MTDSKATLTPGPWTFVVEGGDYKIKDAAGNTIMCDMDYYPWFTLNEADWHLIAAAPEMRNALLFIKAWFMNLEDGEQHRELDGVGILCDTCVLYCPGCGEAVHERADRFSSTQVLQGGVTMRADGKYGHEGCANG